MSTGGYRQAPNYSLRYFGEFPHSRCYLCGQEEDHGHTLLYCLARRRWTSRLSGLLAQAIDASLQVPRS